MPVGKCSACGSLTTVSKGIRLPGWIICDKCGKTALVKRVKPSKASS